MPWIFAPRMKLKRNDFDNDVPKLDRCPDNDVQTDPFPGSISFILLFSSFRFRANEAEMLLKGQNLKLVGRYYGMTIRRRE